MKRLTPRGSDDSAEPGGVEDGGRQGAVACDWAGESALCLEELHGSGPLGEGRGAFQRDGHGGVHARVLVGPQAILSRADAVRQRPDAGSGREWWVAGGTLGECRRLEFGHFAEWKGGQSRRD
jgi:hypothetical protein